MQIGQNHGHLFVKNNKNNRMKELIYAVFVNYVKNLPMRKGCTVPQQHIVYIGKFYLNY